MDRTWKHVVFLWLSTPMVLLAILALAAPTAQALPPPLSPQELTARSDVVIEGRVAQVWLYSQWLTHLKNGGLGPRGKALLQQTPATDEGLLRLIRNFPYNKSGRPAPVAVDGVYLAEVQVEKTLKGQTEGVIFIPFVRFHFTGRSIEGPWTERQYQAGEYLKMYLRQNGPFFESTWWNAVRPVGK